jgi:DNA invertase Pin-like site-specific DNA recombinase
MAMAADEERRMISQRTKAALAAAKKRGVKLGGDRGARLSRAARKAGREAQAARAHDRAVDLSPIIAELQRNGITSLSGIARAFNDRRIPTPRGRQWTATQVARVAARLTV